MSSLIKEVKQMVQACKRVHLQNKARTGVAGSGRAPRGRLRPRTATSRAGPIATGTTIGCATARWIRSPIRSWAVRWWISRAWP